MLAAATRISPAPDFFQQDSADDLREQANGAINSLGLTEAFFAQLLRVEKQQFAHWRRKQGSLSSDKQDDLRAFWRLVLHLLSVQNSDPRCVRGMLDAEVPASSQPPPHGPPWSGTSLREYLQASGTAGVREAEEWVTSLRFRDLYTAR